MTEMPGSYCKAHVPTGQDLINTDFISKPLLSPHKESPLVNHHPG